jgi:hypothetical protein
MLVSYLLSLESRRALSAAGDNPLPLVKTGDNHLLLCGDTSKNFKKPMVPNNAR